MIQPIDVGGLRLAGFDTRVQTCQISLIRYLWSYPSSFFTSVLAHVLESEDLQYLLISKGNLASSVPDNYQLFKQVLSTWARFHLFQPASDQDMQEEPLWNNNRILISRKPAFWHEWKAAGITQIRNLIHLTEPRFLSHDEIALDYGLNVSFLQILQLRSAIPCPWKRLLTSPRIQVTPLKPTLQASNKSVVDVSRVSARKVYSTLIAFKLPTVSSPAKWNDILQQTDVCQEERWREIYTSPYHALRDTKLQTLHFKFTHRIIPCNRYLCKIRIKREDSCSYCDSTDTLQHFFYYCTPVKTFSENLTRWLASICGHLCGDEH